METTESLSVRATPEQIEVAFPEPVSDLKVMAAYGKLANRNLEWLGWQQEQVDERSYIFRPAANARLQLQPGEEHSITVDFTHEGEPARATGFVEVEADEAASYEPDDVEPIVFEETSGGLADADGYDGGPSQADEALASEKAPYEQESPDEPPPQHEQETPPEEGGEQTRTCCDEVANILKVPLRVRAGGGTGGPGGEDLASWSEGVIESVFPRLPHRPDALQFRQSLAEFVGVSASPSPYGGGSVAFAPRTFGSGGGAPAGWSPNGGSSSSSSGMPGWPSSSGGALWLGGGGSPGYPAGAATLSAPGTPSASFFAGASPGAGGPSGTGDLTGPFATLASIAGALEANAVPAARDVGALTQDADLDLIEAERAVVLQILSSLIAELRQPAPDGPEKPTAESLAERLMDHVVELGIATEILVTGSTPPTTPPGTPPTKSTEAVTPADFANVSRFDVLYGWGITAWLAVRAFDPTKVDARARVAIVKQLLGVVVEKTRQLELELDAADFGPAERGRFEVSVGAGGEITIARLLQWLQEQAGRDLPRLLDNSGTLAKDTVTATLSEQEAFVIKLAAETDFPWTYPIVDRLIDELILYLGEAIAEATLL